MSDAFTHAGTQVFVSGDGVSFIPLLGYAGGLQFGMSEELADRQGFDDGIARQRKVGSQGASSEIAVRRIDGDAGQALVRSLTPLTADGRGYMRAEYPDGRVLTAEGLFHSLTENTIDAGEYVGFTFTFSQQEPEVET